MVQQNNSIQLQYSVSSIQRHDTAWLLTSETDDHLLVGELSWEL